MGSGISDEGSIAKLNSTRITTENASEAFSASLVRSSDRKSLAAMVHVWVRNDFTMRDRHQRFDTASLDRRSSPAAVRRNTRFRHAGSARRVSPDPGLREADASTSGWCGLWNARPRSAIAAPRWRDRPGT